MDRAVAIRTVCMTLLLAFFLWVLDHVAKTKETGWLAGAAVVLPPTFFSLALAAASSAPAYWRWAIRLVTPLMLFGICTWLSGYRESISDFWPLVILTGVAFSASWLADLATPTTPSPAVLRDQPLAPIRVMPIPEDKDREASPRSTIQINKSSASPASAERSAPVGVAVMVGVALGYWLAKRRSE